MTDEHRYRVEHVTSYQHAGRVATSQHVAHLEPRVHSRQQLIQFELTTDPGPASVARRIDYFGNVAHHLTILTPYTNLRVSSRSVVTLLNAQTLDARRSTPWEVVSATAKRRDGLEPAVSEFSYRSPFVIWSPELIEYAAASFPVGRPVVDGAIDLMHRIHTDFTFLPNVTSIATPVTRVLADRQGVCQDFAHLQIACLRSIGLPARYVSGYLLTDPPPGQPRLIGADASHAWLAVYCPVFGWVELDPTNDVVPDTRHITLAWGRDYGDVSPLRGVVLGGDEDFLRVGVSVTPVDAGSLVS